MTNVWPLYPHWWQIEALEGDWRAYCTCGWEGAVTAHKKGAEREARAHQAASSVIRNPRTGRRAL